MNGLFARIVKTGVEINNKKFMIPEDNAHESHMNQIYNFSNPTLKECESSHQKPSFLENKVEKEVSNDDRSPEARSNSMSPQPRSSKNEANSKQKFRQLFGSQGTVNSNNEDITHILSDSNCITPETKNMSAKLNSEARKRNSTSPGRRRSSVFFQQNLPGLSDYHHFRQNQDQYKFQRLMQVIENQQVEILEYFDETSIIPEDLKNLMYEMDVQLQEINENRRIRHGQ